MSEMQKKKAGYLILLIALTLCAALIILGIVLWRPAQAEPQPPHIHKEGRIEAVPATCTTPGKTAGTYCTLCDAILQTPQNVLPTWHKNVSAENGVKPTCTTPGHYADIVCAICDLTLRQGDIRPATGHTIEAIGEDRPATCTKDGYIAGKQCSVCDTVLQEAQVSPATGHTPVTVGKTTPPTCIREGSTPGVYCLVCRATLKQPVILSRLEHTYGAWSAGAEHHTRTCAVCNQQEEGAHTYTGETVGNARVYTCLCGDRYQEDFNIVISPSTSVSASDAYTQESLHNGLLDLGGNSLTMNTNTTIHEGTLTVVGGTVENQGGDKYLDVRPEAEQSVCVIYEDVDFISTYQNRTYGPCTDRVTEMIKIIPKDGTAEFVFRNCHFENANVYINGLTGYAGEVKVTFIDCTFSYLGTGSAVEVDNYLTVDITFLRCQFDYTATASAAVVDAMPSSTVTVKATDCLLNGTAAAPTTDPALAGTVEEIKVMNPAVKWIGSDIDQDTVTGLICTGIATER